MRTSIPSFLKVTVLFNLVSFSETGNPQDLIADEDSVQTARDIEKTLAEMGIKTDLLEITETNMKQVLSCQTDIFFNQAFGLGNLPKSEAKVARLLEKGGKMYTGSGAEAIELSNDKIATKRRFLENGIPNANFVVDSDIFFDSKISLKFPLIVKLTNEHSSLGMDSKSVVYTFEGLIRKVSDLRRIYQQNVLVEEFIDGRELNATVIGNGDDVEVLPISEITFGGYYKHKPKIVDFKAKWEEEAIEYRETVGVCPAKLSERARKRVEEMAKKVYKISGCRDYARVDFRLARGGEPYVLEFNANPGIGPKDGVIRSAKAAGYSYAQFLEKILNTALQRYA